MSLSDPLGLEYEKQRALQLAELMLEWSPQGQTEKMLVTELHHHLVNHTPQGAKVALQNLVKLQHLRSAKTPADIAQAVEFFHK